MEYFVCDLPKLYCGKISRTCETLGDNALDIDVGGRIMMRTPHLEEDKAAADGGIEADGALVLVLLDMKVNQRSHELASHGSYGFLCSELCRISSLSQSHARDMEWVIEVSRVSGAPKVVKCSPG
jgi:hypothetical protein